METIYGIFSRHAPVNAAFYNILHFNGWEFALPSSPILGFILCQTVSSADRGENNSKLRKPTTNEWCLIVIQIRQKQIQPRQDN